MQIFYHVTLKSNLNSIFKKGLEPRIGALSTAYGEPVARIYLFKDIEDMETALSSWLGEAINNTFGENIECCSLEISLPDSFLIYKGNAEYEWYVYDIIPPEYIKHLRDE